MSKIGRVNLELTEEANELGYDSVGEAIADGWEANEIAATLTKKDELREAHEAWLKEKADVLKELHSLLQFDKDSANTNYELAYMLEKSLDKIKHAIEFIEKGEV